MTETPFPETSELLALAPLVNGRLSLAQKELVRRLRGALPSLATEFNAAEGLTGNRTVPVPDPFDIDVAPKNVTDDHIGKILVGVRVSTGDQGPGAFLNRIQVVIFAIDQRIEFGEQVFVLWERAELIRLALFPYLTGCVDAQGRRVWRQLIPTGYSLLPGDWRDYSGTSCTFNMVQPPNMDTEDTD